MRSASDGRADGASAGALLAQLAKVTQARTVVRDCVGGRAIRLRTDVQSRFDGHDLMWIESGEWESGPRTRNTLRWTLRDGALELGRHRASRQPALLARFTRCRADRFDGAAPFLCGQDRYTPSLRVGRATVVLRWRITGPVKHMVITTRYC